VRSYELLQISHLVKFVRIPVRSGWYYPVYGCHAMHHVIQIKINWGSSQVYLHFTMVSNTAQTIEVWTMFKECITSIEKCCQWC